MNCPKCNGELQARTSDDVEIDVCQRCGGIWLDSGELEKIMAISQQENWRLYDRGREGYDPTPAPTPSKSYLERLLHGDQS
jgi:Zn-finger nucleic acid-binding protein